MPRASLIRRSAVFATVIAIGATTLFGGAGPAQATHSAPSHLLTASNGTKQITTQQGVLVANPDYTIRDASWAPDGSRAVFVTGGGDIATIRWDNGHSVYPIVNPPEPDTQRADPEWVGDGSTVVWAAKSAGTPWRIEETRSTYGWGVVRRSPNDGHHYSQPDTNGSRRIVVQRQADDGNGNPTGTPEIGFLDGSTYTRIITNAASPTLSPDGTRVAFVRDGQIWVCDSLGGDLVQVTDNPAVHADPVWFPNGTTLAFRKGSGVATAPADNSQPNPPLVSGLTGEPDVQPRRQDRVVRLAGTTRYSTAAAIAQSHWATHDDPSDPRATANAVVLSRSDTFADALGGSALAAAKQGPLLMTPRASLDPLAASEIQRILAPGKTVYLLGSANGAISAEVEQQVKNLGFNTVRLAGTDRFATSVAIANEINPSPDMVLAATGMNFPDALSAGAAAGAQNLPGKGTSAVVVLTNDEVLPDATRNYLDQLPSSTLLAGIGLQAATATAPYGSVPLYGDSRFETALLTAWAFFGGQTHMGLATGMDWPDALAGGALMASLDGPLVLTLGTADYFGLEPWYLGDETSGSVHTGLVFGSASVVNAFQVEGLGETISGPAGYISQSNSTDVYRSTAGPSVSDKREAADAVNAPRSRAELEAAVKAAKERLKK